MIYHKIVTISAEYNISGVDLDLPITSLGKNAKAGVCGRPLGTYTFLQPGRYFGEFKLPKFMAMGEEIHAWVEGSEMKDRKRWEIVDFDEMQILLRRLHDNQ
jgi:hypothetical protein